MIKMRIDIHADLEQDVETGQYMNKDQNARINQGIETDHIMGLTKGRPCKIGIRIWKHGMLKQAKQGEYTPRKNKM